jgi:hypothetical protein
MLDFKNTGAPTVAAPPRMPQLKPREVTTHGLETYPRSPWLRLMNSAYHATLAAADKPHFRPRHVVIRFVGPAGVGKTAIVEEYTRSESIGYVKLDAMVSDIAELFGLKDVTDGQTISALPNWWPKPNTYGVINVDD